MDKVDDASVSLLFAEYAAFSDRTQLSLKVSYIKRDINYINDSSLVTFAMLQHSDSGI